MLDLIEEFIRLILEGIRAAEKAENEKTKREHELTALRLAERRIQTEIARRTLPP